MAPQQHAAAGDRYAVIQAGIEGPGGPWAGNVGAPEEATQASKVCGWHILHLLCLNIYCLEAVFHADSSIKKVQLEISNLAVFILKYPLKKIYILKYVGCCSCEHIHAHT